MSHPSIAGIPLVLGGNVFGWNVKDDLALAVLDAFYEAGGRMIDTAQGYSEWVPGHVGGESEAELGKWLESRGVRGEMRIATKVNIWGKPGLLAPAHVAAELDKSLERLRTDYIDLYYAHRDEPETPQDEVAAGFAALLSNGKVKELGASNFSLDRLASARDAAARIGVPGYTVLQNEYNLVERGQYEGALQDYCVANDVVSLPYYGLAAGFLTGKYRTPADLEGRLRGSSAARYMEAGKPVLAAMDKVAAESGATHAQIALAWLMAQPGVAAPIASATSPEQVRELCGAAKLTLNAEQLARLSGAMG